MGKTYHFLQLSSLEKVFVDDDISRMKETFGAYALKGERVSWQILYTADVTDSVFNSKAQVRVSADERLTVLLRQVGNVPVTMPTYPNQSDEFYLRKTPGVYPDILAPLEVMLVREGRCHSLFVTCEVPCDMEAGEYPITVTFTMDDAEVEKTFTLRVLNALLPPQKLTYTQWFHADSLASYYNLEIFSEEHWERIDQFLAGAARIGINMILTPVFTLALDTEVGKERPTLQLVDVFRKNGVYSFGFARLKRWIELCKKNGIERFEISHLFAQWGTGFTPKIEAETEQGREKIFGWHTPAADSGYREFLQAFLPELIGFLKAEGVYDQTRIIIVADHGWALGYPGNEETAKAFSFCAFNPVLMVKDFGSREDFRVDGTFRTNADTPSIAFRDLIEAPWNPYLEKAVTDEDREKKDHRICGADWHVQEGATVFNGSYWTFTAE